MFHFGNKLYEIFYRNMGSSECIKTQWIFLFKQWKQYILRYKYIFRKQHDLNLVWKSWVTLTSAIFVNKNKIQKKFEQAYGAQQSQKVSHHREKKQLDNTMPQTRVFNSYNWTKSNKWNFYPLSFLSKRNLGCHACCQYGSFLWCQQCHLPWFMIRHVPVSLTTQPPHVKTASKSPSCARWQSLILPTSTKELYSCEQDFSSWWNKCWSTDCIYFTLSNPGTEHASPTTGPTGLHLYSLCAHLALPEKEWTSEEKHGARAARSWRKTRHPVSSEWKSTFKWKESSKTHGWATENQDNLCFDFACHTRWVNGFSRYGVSQDNMLPNSVDITHLWCCA